MVSFVRPCPNCGHENPLDADFCASCNSYVRWEPTGELPAVAPPAADETTTPPAPATPAEGGAPATPPPPAADVPAEGEQAAPGAPPRTRLYPAVMAPAVPPPESIVLTLEVPGADGAPSGTVTTKVDAGGQTVLVGHVRNQSGVVDRYHLRVEGVPEAWWTITPDTVYLVPFGSAADGYEQEVEVRLHPPRAPEAEAREWPLRVVATSTASGTDVAESPADLSIAPYHELESELRPERSTGRLRGKHAIAVRNRGNAPVEIALAGTDPDDKLRMRFERRRLLVEPGRRDGTAFTVRPPKQIFLGRPVDRRFGVAAKVVATEAAAPPRDGVFRQQPWLPWWLLVAVPVIAALALAAWQLRPNDTVVPDLTAAASVFEAQELLTEAGLQLGNTAEKTTDASKPGTILAQTPAAGEEVAKGGAVDIQLAVGTGTGRVPKVVGLTLLQADTILRKAGFQLGQARPEPADPERDKIASQSPPTGTVTERGAAVAVIFKVKEPAPTTPVAETTASETSGDGGGDQPPPPPPPPVALPPATVPALDALSLDAALDAVVKAGLVPVEARRISADAPAGKVFEQLPPPGSTAPRGSKVTLVVSAGFPRIAFDRDGDLLVAAGSAGRPVDPLAQSDEAEEHAAWNPVGTLVAYRRGPAKESKGRIWLVTPGKADSARPLTADGFDDRRPVFSPDGKVVAFIRGDTSRTYTDLCFQRVAGGAADCKEDPDRLVSRPAWSPDGRSILVVASDAADEQEELLLYTSRRPSSARADDWESQGLVTDKLHGKRKDDSVTSAAWRPPDGKQIAFSANWGEQFFHLHLSTAEGGVLGKPGRIPRIRACELAWRPDGGELAFTRRNAGCNEEGEIVRVVPSEPEEQTSLTRPGASNPAWEPLTAGP